MTTYNYLSEMQDFCFKAAMAMKGIGDLVMKEFYEAAEEGYGNRLSKLSVEEAEQNITQAQIDQYLHTKDFVQQKENEAAEKLRKEAEQFKPTENCLEEAYDEWEKQLDENQEYDDKMQAKLEAIHD